MIKSSLIGFLVLFCIGVTGSWADLSAQQVIKLRNPSFEDTPRAGGFNTYPKDIRGWFDCGTYRFKRQTPPDIHPTDGFAWSVDSRPQDGDSYLGMVVRFDDTWESLGQPLSETILAGNCYNFSIYLSKSDIYLSPTTLNTDSIVNFTTPIVFRIWGGNSFCDKAELLGESDPVKNLNWKPYFFKFQPKRNHKYIVIEAFYRTPTPFPYNGHILIDNASDIVQMPCDEELDIAELEKKYEEKPRVEIAVNTPPKEEPKVKPAEKKEEKVKEEQKITEAKPQSKEEFKPEILEELNTKKLSEGQTIRIRDLYFKADSSRIEKESYPVLDELYDFLIANPEIVVEIGGHTNTKVSPDYAFELSNARAEAVADYLTDKGLSEEQVLYKGYGKESPIVKHDKFSRTLQRKNQRVEIKILSLKKAG